MVKLDEEAVEARGNFVFGVFDGLTSILGVIVGALVASATRNTLIATSVGLAVAATFSMASGEYLGDPNRHLHDAVYMGVATLIGTLTPIIPFLLTSRGVAVACSGILAMLMCAGIAFIRSKTEPTLRSWIETYGLFIGVTAVTVLTVFLTGAAG